MKRLFPFRFSHTSPSPDDGAFPLVLALRLAVCAASPCLSERQFDRDRETAAVPRGNPDERKRNTMVYGRTKGTAIERVSRIPERPRHNETVDNVPPTLRRRRTDKTDTPLFALTFDSHSTRHSPIYRPFVRVIEATAVRDGRSRNEGTGRKNKIAGKGGSQKYFKIIGLSGYSLHRFRLVGEIGLGAFIDCRFDFLIFF